MVNSVISKTGNDPLKNNHYKKADHSIYIMLKKVLVSLLLLLVCRYTFAFDSKSVSIDLTVVAAENHLVQYLENGVNKGPTIEILQRLLTESQLKADILFMPWARAFSKAKQEPNTVILSMIRTPARESYFHWLIKVSQAARVFISLKHKPQNSVSTFQQAKGKLIAVIRNTSAHKELVAQGFSEQKNLYLVSDTMQMINLFVKGRVDLLYTDPNLVLDYLEKQSEQNIEIYFPTITEEHQRNSYIAANINMDKAILSRLKAASETFQQTPYYQYLLTK